MKHNIIPLSAQSDWNHALKKVPHAFGHTWDNCYAIQLSTGLNTYLYHFKDSDVHIVCPISERHYSGYTDIVTPYGFSGFVGNKEYPDFHKHWKHFATDQNYICGYIGLNSIIEEKSFFGKNEIYSNNILYAIDLTLSLDQLYHNLSTNRRRQVKNHEKVLFTFIQGGVNLEKFIIKNYHDFFSRYEDSQLYNFTIETVSNLINSDNVILLGKQVNNKIVAVSVFACSPYVAEYLFNVSLPEGREHTVPLLWESIRVLKEMGIPILNLGGGIKKGDSLAEFKERFGPKQYPLTALKQVYNRHIFQELCNQAEAESTDSNGFFPPYHRV